MRGSLNWLESQPVTFEKNFLDNTKEERRRSLPIKNLGKTEYKQTENELYDKCFPGPRPPSKMSKFGENSKNDDQSKSGFYPKKKNQKIQRRKSFGEGGEQNLEEIALEDYSKDDGILILLLSKFNLYRIPTRN